MSGSYDIPSGPSITAWGEVWAGVARVVNPVTVLIHFRTP